MERYSRSEEGAVYSFGWKEEDGSITWDPMHGDPLQLVPEESRAEICAYLNEGHNPDDDSAYTVEIHGEVCPLSRYVMQERLAKADGDWTKVMQDVVVRRILFCSWMMP